MSDGTTKPHAARRRALAISKIHVGKRGLALTDETYRAVLERVTGKRSCKDMTEVELGRVIEELARLGAYRRKARGRAGARRLAAGEQAAKIRALWLGLYHLGEVGDPAEAALARYAKRMTAGANDGAGVDDLSFLTPVLADRVIKGLRGWAGRVGWKQSNAADRSTLSAMRKAAGIEDSPAGLADKVVLIEAQWQRLIALGAMRTGEFARLDTWLRKQARVADPAYLSGDQADRAIERLGRWVRSAKAAADKGDAA